MIKDHNHEYESNEKSDMKINSEYKDSYSEEDNEQLLKEFGLEDVNEILSKNDYQFLEKSNLKNDPNASIEHKLIKIYKLSWRSDKVTELLHIINKYVKEYFSENKKMHF
ncbi:hypothetical protein C1645_828931 [Glomus cerebriforme]|uniref:Uncharacterized protein n=1 Tax=Glomus cerebriforme TaxID=658196 RepID=A0A397SUS7_9GLOM|nr:hypothetical protein C1645_828931 [Glomus cerebriforme]